MIVYTLVTFTDMVRDHASGVVDSVVVIGSSP